MEVTSNNLCNSCTNFECEFQSGIVRKECAFYMPPQLEPDNCGNADYKARLKDDMVAILTELQLEIEKIVKEEVKVDKKWANGLHYSEKIIQQKIDALKGEKDGNNVVQEQELFEKEQQIKKLKAELDFAKFRCALPSILETYKR